MATPGVNPAPLTPITPTSIFAALALSPTLAAAHPDAMPTLHFSPPSPASSSSRSSSSASSSSADRPVSSSPFVTSTGSSDTGNYTSPEASSPTVIHRALASNEAKQLTLLLTQHLFPVRNNPKGLMSEAISLAEKLHDVGIRWDCRRRVMGMHLRGIWEEGQRLGNHKSMGGHGPMDLYVQGSFLSIAEEPHPLDPMPIPLEVHPASFTALPKLTLKAGLAGSLPGAPTLLDAAFPSTNATGKGAVGKNASTGALTRVRPLNLRANSPKPIATPVDMPFSPFSPSPTFFMSPFSSAISAAATVGHGGGVIDLGDIALRSATNTGIHGGISRYGQIGHLAVGSKMVLRDQTPGQHPQKGAKKSWRERKKAGLNVRTDGQLKPRHPHLSTPRTALSAGNVVTGFMLVRLLFHGNGKSRNGLKKSQQPKSKPSRGGFSWANVTRKARVFNPRPGNGRVPITPGGAISARRVSFGGWEVR